MFATYDSNFQNNHHILFTSKTSMSSTAPIRIKSRHSSRSLLYSDTGSVPAHTSVYGTTSHTGADSTHSSVPTHALDSKTAPITQQPLAALHDDAELDSRGAHLGVSVLVLTARDYGTQTRWHNTRMVRGYVCRKDPAFSSRQRKLVAKAQLLNVLRGEMHKDELLEKEAMYTLFENDDFTSTAEYTKGMRACVYVCVCHLISGSCALSPRLTWTLSSSSSPLPCPVPLTPLSSWQLLFSTTISSSANSNKSRVGRENFIQFTTRPCTILSVCRT
jgi:hypothetical protein